MEHCCSKSSSLEETKEDDGLFCIVLFLYENMYTSCKMHMFMADFLLTVIVQVSTVTVKTSFYCNSILETYSLSNSKDLIENNGDFGSRL